MVMGFCGCALSHFMNCFRLIFIFISRSSIFCFSAGVSSPRSARSAAIILSALPGSPEPLLLDPAVELATAAAAALAACSSWALRATLLTWAAFRTVLTPLLIRPMRGVEDSNDVIVEEETVVAVAAMRRHIMGEAAAVV